MRPTSIKKIINTSLISAFTIAAALIWKDVIIEGISIFFPSQDQFVIKLLVAIIATVLIVVSIYTIMKTESEAEMVYQKFKNRKSVKKI